MPSHSTQLFIVCTISHDDRLLLPHFQQRLLEWINSQTPTRHIVILEWGEHRDNPHFNVVLQYPTTKRTDVVRKSLQKFVYIGLLPDYVPTLHDVKVKMVHDHNTLIGGYLSKEQGHQVISNNGYDLTECKDKAKLRPAIHSPGTSRTLTDAQCVPAIIAYGTEYTMPIRTPEDVLQIIVSMTKSGYSFAKCLSRLAYHVNATIATHSPNSAEADNALLYYLTNTYRRQHDPP